MRHSKQFPLTLGRRNGQVALPLASTGCGGRSVRVGVLPLLEKALGLLDDQLW
jgi:hypothetical protein